MTRDETAAGKRYTMSGSGFLTIAVLATGLLVATPSANALEGGLGAYFLGTRDSMAGYVPPPGTYITNTYYHVHGQAPECRLPGAPR